VSFPQSRKLSGGREFFFLRKILAPGESPRRPDKTGVTLIWYGGEMKKIIVVAMVILLAAACKQKEEPKGQYQFPTGNVQTRDDTKLLEEFVKKEPGNVEAWIKLGNAQMDTRRFNEAINAYQKALAINPKNVDVIVDMGTCYRNSGRPVEAMKEYRKALDFDPRHLQAHRNLGIVLAYDLQDKAQAVKEFEKYLELAPNAQDAGQVRQTIQEWKAGK
jgi:tetratricopeptide (TPR) repeat protein